jgi:hypothetical protein
MKLPPSGFTIPEKVLTADQDIEECVLKLEKNLYGQKTSRKSMVSTLEEKFD